MKKETEFKVLMHCGEYVNVNLLGKGIYSCDKPFIYSKDETIETLVQRGVIMKDFEGNNFISDEYFGNLRRCELVSVTITESIHD